MAKEKKKQTIELGNGYFLDEDFTLIKHIVNSKGKIYEKNVGYFTSLGSALKRWGEECIKDGIKDGSIECVKECIARYEYCVNKLERESKRIVKELSGGDK